MGFTNQLISGGPHVAGERLEGTGGDALQGDEGLVR